MLPAKYAKTDIVPAYTWIAPTHDWLAVLVEAKARRLGLTWASVEDGMRVLEVAVGTGLSFQHLLRQNPNGFTEGVDLTPAMLRRAEQRARKVGHSNYRLRPGDAYDLDFPDDTFDVLLNSYMFDMLPVADFVPVLEGFRRVLRPGGRLVMMNLTLPTCWHERVWDRLYRLHPFLLGGCRGITVAPALEAAGFVNIHREFVSQRTFPSEVVRAEKST